jgi:hypothetical protein
MADISETLAPKSDQLDNIDLRGKEPRIFTVTRVDVKPDPLADQPVTVHLAEFPRPWKPGKNMRRVLAHCWGRESDNWVGKRVELFADESVKFGNETPGGTRISRLSGIDGPQKAPIMLSQGRPGIYKVDPLPDAPAEPTPAELAEQLVAALADATTEAEVREWGNRAHARGLLDLQVKGETVKSHVTKRLAELTECELVDEPGGASA